MHEIGQTFARRFRETQPIHRHLRDLRSAAGRLAPLDHTLDAIVDLVAAYIRNRTDILVEDPELAACFHR